MNFTVFQYPKSKHTRSLTPRLFKRYQTYKRYLQHEFARTCVYCRQPDSSAPNLNFGVDHYRPKGIAKFASLERDYQNLYYCCGSCNSRKNNDWPKDELKGPYIVNPCDYIMSQHLRFESTSGIMAPRTKFGEYTEELLQLNDPIQVEYRKTTLQTLKMAASHLAALKNQKSEILKLFQQNKIPADVYNDESNAIDDEIETIEVLIQNNTGTKPLLRVRNLK
ncbi:HNH endonuclease [Pseudomonas sp. UV AK001]|uniref:HNH endonuclease n=1 Tax=Pseudomonas sp. UV AK001 TaxID=3384791 RepID=UPI0038D408EC